MSTPLVETAARLAALSRWLDDANAHRDAEARTWARIAKVSEEAGEAIAAYIGATGQNPRKGVTHTTDDVREELLDVAITALGAIEHLTDHSGSSMDLLESKITKVCERAGLTLHTCGHAQAVRGCGGCDPGAIDYVIEDGGTRRPFDPARDMTGMFTLPRTIETTQETT